MGLSFFTQAAALSLRRAPLRPTVTDEIIQPEARSAGGVRFGFDVYAHEEIIALNWQGLSTAELAALLAFVENALDFMGEPFSLGEPLMTYDGHIFLTDDAAGAQEDFCPRDDANYRLADPTIAHRESAPGRHTAILTLMRD